MWSSVARKAHQYSRLLVRNCNPTDDTIPLRKSFDCYRKSLQLLLHNGILVDREDYLHKGLCIFLKVFLFIQTNY
jgi:hypothetical protein